MEAERICIWDNAKVWLMIMVIIGHTVIASYGHSDVFLAYVWFFLGGYIITMPLFFFISGFFTKRGGVKINKLCKNILLPFMVFNVLYKLYEPLFNEGHYSNWKVPGFAMWFLWVLFLFRFLFPLIIKIRYVFPLSLAVALVIGFIPQIGADYGLNRFLCFLPFYLLGYYVGHHKKLQCVKDYMLAPFSLRDGLVLGCIIVAWCVILYHKPSLAFCTTFNGGYGGNWLYMIVRMSLYITAIGIGFYVLKLVPNKKVFYTKYGSRTMGVYLLHGLVVLPFAYKVFTPFEESDVLHKVLMIAIPVAISLLFFSKATDSTIKKLF